MRRIKIVALSQSSEEDDESSSKSYVLKDPQCNNSPATDPPKAAHRGTPFTPEIDNQLSLRIDNSNYPTFVTVSHATEKDDAPSRKEFPPEGLQDEDRITIAPSELGGDYNASNAESCKDFAREEHRPLPRLMEMAHIPLAAMFASVCQANLPRF